MRRWAVGVGVALGEMLLLAAVAAQRAVNADEGFYLLAGGRVLGGGGGPTRTSSSRRCRTCRTCRRSRLPWLALALIKRDRTLDEIRVQYRVSHTTAYKIRNAFLEGGRAALSGDRRGTHATDLEARVRAIEARLEQTGRADWGLGRDSDSGSTAPRADGAVARARGRGPASGNGSGR